MYQKCPICEGRGTLGFISNYDKNPCPTCNGKRVIHTQSGLPPRPVVTRIEAPLQSNVASNGVNKETGKMDPRLNKFYRKPSLPGSGEPLTVPDLTNSQGHQLEYD